LRKISFQKLFSHSSEEKKEKYQAPFYMKKEGEKMISIGFLFHQVWVMSK